ncbi:Spy/CpxP family protein refolding chaperone [Candidatus Omnitrophota bacterium]
MKARFIALMSLILVLVLSFAVPATYAYDCGKSKGKGHSSKGLDEKIFYKAHFILKNEEELGLSDEQVKEIKDLKIKTKKDLIKSKAEIELAALDVKTKLWEDVIDTEAISGLIDKKYELKKAKVKSLVEAYAALKNILTEDQKKTLKSLWRNCKTGNK